MTAKNRGVFWRWLDLWIGLALAAAAILWVLFLTYAVGVLTLWALPYCDSEDGYGQSVCVWDESVLGNGDGRSFVFAFGEVTHLPSGGL